MPVMSYSSTTYLEYVEIGLQEVCVASTFSLPGSEFEEIRTRPSIPRGGDERTDHRTRSRAVRHGGVERRRRRGAGSGVRVLKHLRARRLDAERVGDRHLI